MKKVLVEWKHISLKEQIEGFYIKNSVNLLTNEDVDNKITEAGINDKGVLLKKAGLTCKALSTVTKCAHGLQQLSKPDYAGSIILKTSAVVTAVNPPILPNRFSYVQNGQLSFSASATIGAVLTLFSIRENSTSKSASGSFDFSLISSLCFLTSLKRRSGATSSSFGENSKSVILPPVNADSTTFASTTSSTYFSSASLFLYSLYRDSFTLCPSSNASFSVSFDFATIDLNSPYSLTFSAIALLLEVSK